MRCPSCSRPTQPRPRSYRGGAPLKGVLTAALADGTCFHCYQGSGKHRNRITRPKTTEQDLLVATRSLLTYWQARQRRGVPSEGLEASALVKPGLFLTEVP